MAEATGTVVFDTAVLILAERDARTYKSLRAALDAERILPAVPLPVLAEAWRGRPRQADLARALKGIDKLDCTEAIARRAGELLAATGGSNAIDAIVVATAETRHAPVVTGDSGDLSVLAAHAEGVAIQPL